MKYEEFCKEFKEGVLANKRWNIKEEHYKFYPKGFASDDEQENRWVRTTNEKYYQRNVEWLLGDFVVLKLKKSEDELVESRYRMRDVYALYQKEKWYGVWNMLDSHMRLLRESTDLQYKKLFESYETEKDRLVVRAINYERNEVQLDGMVYKRYEDIALVLYVMLYNDERGFGSVKVPRVYLEKWGKDEEELFERAIENSMRIMPPRMYTDLADIMNLDSDPETGIFMESGITMGNVSTTKTALVKTTNQNNGAIALFYPGVKERIAELLGGNYYVSFLSIHEAYIHLVGSLHLENIHQSLIDLNASFPEEMLTDHIFLYDAKSETFEAIS